MKYKLIFLTAITLAAALPNCSLGQSKNPLYEIIIDRDGFSSFEGKNYTSVTIFLNNNTNETLYYQGVGCYNMLFVLKSNPYFHLAKEICKNPVYTKMILPPHRSQKMEIFLTMDKQPDKDVLLTIRMKLYKWTGKKIVSNEGELSGKLTDTTILHYNNNHQYFWTREEALSLEKKQGRILPNKDIYLLTDTDKKLYKLTVDEKQISPSIDTLLTTYGNNTSKKAKVVRVPISLVNSSSDTLRFYSMTCSWFEFWGTDKSGIGLPGWGCTKNIPKIISVAPHTKYNRILNIVYDSTVKKSTYYRISMSLLKAQNDTKWTWNFWPGEYVRFNKIWSNELMID